MSKPATKSYPAEFKERAVKLAVESDQPIAPGLPKSPVSG